MEPTDDARIALARLQAAVEDGALPRTCVRHGVDLIVVFGSVLRDGPPARDLDLAVGHDGRLDVLALLEDCYQLTGYERLDLLDLARAGIVARSEALGDGRLLWEAVPGTFAERQVVALAMAWDTRWLRDLELQQLASP